jgi:hypothetical protein
MQMPEKAVRGLDLLKESTRIDMGDVADQDFEIIDY